MSFLLHFYSPLVAKLVLLLIFFYRCQQNWALCTITFYSCNFLLLFSYCWFRSLYEVCGFWLAWAKLTICRVFCLDRPKSIVFTWLQCAVDSSLCANYNLYNNGGSLVPIRVFLFYTWSLCMRCFAWPSQNVLVFLCVSYLITYVLWLFGQAKQNCSSLVSTSFGFYVFPVATDTL